MNIIPKLSIKDNINTIENNSLVNAYNINISDDGLLQTEYNIEKNNINKTIEDYGELNLNNKSYNIIHCLECSEELIIFVLFKGEKNLVLFRYNEKENNCISVTNSFVYNGGNLISKYIYNKNNLIIAISEYFDDNDSIKIPLKVLNLGEFKYSDFLDENDLNQLNKSELHTLLPSVKIPSVNTTIVEGNSLKGWYYIFIRYKISTDTYTKWFNTNQSVFLDSYNKENILDYSGITNNEYFRSTSYIDVSDNKDIVSNSFIMNFNGLDNENFKEYQIGLILLTKETSKAYYSEDLNIEINSIKFNNFLNYSLIDILTNYNNYYNVKVLESFNNKLYIGNYEELIENIDTSKIKLEISASSSKLTDKENDNTVYIQKCVKYTTTKSIFDYSLINDPSPTNISDKIYFNIDTFIYKGKQINGLIGSVIVNSGNDYFVSGETFKNQNVLILCELYTLNDKNEEISNLVYSYNTTLDKIVILKNENNENDKCGLDLAILNDIQNKTVVKPWEIKFTESANFIPNDNLYNQTKFKFYIFIGDRITNFTNYYNISFPNGIYENPFYKNDDIQNKLYIDTFNVIKSGIKWDDIKETKKEIDINNININNKNYILTPGTSPYEWYSFYIHFINKYGEITKGFPINEFNLSIKNENIYNENIIVQPIDDTEIKENIEIKPEFKTNLTIYSIINQSNLKLLSLTDIKSKDNSYNFKLLSDNFIDNSTYNFYFKLSNIPTDFEGYFVSYEKIEKTILHHGFAQYKIDEEENTSYINLFNNQLNYKNTIDFNFNKIVFCKINDNTLFNKFDNNLLNANVNIVNNNLSKSYIENVIDKQLVIAEENFSDETDHNTRIKVQVTNNLKQLENDNYYFCLFINDDISSKYINSVKELIPCSDIIYKFDNLTKINIKNAFISKTSTLYYKASMIYNTPENKFISFGTGNVIKLPYYTISYIFYDDILNETVQFKNKPNVVVISGNSDSNTNYYKNKIIEYKNIIDLFIEKNVNYYQSYPVVLKYKNNTNTNNKFYNSIRRSEAILDESYENNWRKFNTDLYKNLPENKGEVVRLINTGNNILIHTKHSLFILDGSDTIKTSDDGKIQLASIDIWDINLKELTPSVLGYGGLDKIEHSISGNFGYIWYNDEKIFMLNGNNNFTLLSNDISSFINKNNNIELTNLFEDITNSRIIFKFNDNSGISENGIINLTYNYKINSFISFLNYFDSDYKIFNTKSKSYIILNNKTEVYNYDLLNSINKYNESISEISILFNDNYNDIKVIESIVYSLNKKHILEETTNSILDRFVKPIDYYCGDYLSISSENYSTDTIDISIDENDINNVNKIDKPFLEFGKWKFNNIRNNYINGEIKNNDELKLYERSLIYGKYFILTLCFKNENVYQLTSVDFNVSKI